MKAPIIEDANDRVPLSYRITDRLHQRSFRYGSRGKVSQITADVGVDFIATGTAKCGGSNGNVLAVLDRARSEQKGGLLA